MLRSYETIENRVHSPSYKQCYQSSERNEKALVFRLEDDRWFYYRTDFIVCRGHLNEMYGSQYRAALYCFAVLLVEIRREKGLKTHRFYEWLPGGDCHVQSYIVF